MIRFASALSLAAILAVAPAVAQDTPGGFQLPPAPAPTQDNRVQGPVDTEAVVPVRPRAIETARAASPAPTPTASAAPTIILPTATPTSPAAAAPVPSRSAPAARTTQPVLQPIPTPLAPIDARGEPAIAMPSPMPLPSAGASAVPSATTPAAPKTGLPWLWIVFGVLAAAGGAALILRRRRAVPEIPTILTPLAPALAPALNQAAEALAISVEAVRMDRSVMNATVGYRVTLRNRTAHALSGVTIEADLVSASNNLPAEAQLASPGQELTPRHAADRLAPGQSLRFEGQVRLPLAEASAIWQGRVGLLVPLLKVRAAATGADAIATTLVIGRREGAAARPQPFRLDEPPRSYAPLAQRTLDALPARA